VLPFVLDIGEAAPPSVRLLPSRPYSGSAIGTAYEVQLFAGKTPDEMPKRRKMVTMSVRLMERPPRTTAAPACVAVKKASLLNERSLNLEARLDAGQYRQGDVVTIYVRAGRAGGHGAKRMRVSVTQQVGVAMFSTGNFKNCLGAAVKDLNPSDEYFTETFQLKISLTDDYSWVAMDEGASKRDADANQQLAPTVVHASRAMFIIRVNYYVHVSLHYGMLQRKVSLKLPFLLQRPSAAESAVTKKS